MSREEHVEKSLSIMSNEITPIRLRRFPTLWTPSFFVVASNLSSLGANPNTFITVLANGTLSLVDCRDRARTVTLWSYSPSQRKIVSGACFSQMREHEVVFSYKTPCSLNVIDMRNIHYSIITGSKSPSLLSSTSLSMGSLYPISLHPFFSSVVASFLSDLGRVRRYSVGRKLHSHPSAHGNDASPFPKRNNRRTVQVGWNCDASIPSLSGFSLSLRSQCSCAVPSNPRDRL